MVLRALCALLVLCGCGVQSEDGGEPPAILAASQIVTPGGYFFVATSTDIDSVEVRVGGEPVHGSPWYLNPDGEFGIFQVPAGTDFGPARVSIRVPGSDDDSDHVEIEVVDPTFVDVSSQTGLSFVHDASDFPEECAEAMTGLGFADFDGDGDLDFFVGSISGESRLMRNDGDLDADGLPDFAEVTAQTGLGGIDLVANVTFADYDNDGDTDLFVGRRGPNRLFQNQLVPSGEATFTDVTVAVGLPADDEQRSAGAGFGDYDGDGDLDLYVVNHAWCFPSVDETITHHNEDHLFRNDGGQFTEVTYLLDDSEGQVTGRFGFNALWVDYDLDGDQDLFVINDYVMYGGRSVVWDNQGSDGNGGWSFVSVASQTGFVDGSETTGGPPVNAMGVSVGDVDRDGYPDFAFTNIGSNFLLLGTEVDGSRGFEDVSEAAGIRRATLPWGSDSITWGTHLFDHDNDGDLDLFYVGGELKGNAPKPHAFFDNLGDGRFDDRTWESGLAHPGHGKGSALVDLDGDGFPEIVVANWSSELEVYRNQLPDQGNTNHWLVVDLVGDGVNINRDALGARVALTTSDGVTQTCFRTPKPSMAGSGDPACFFGLGANEVVTNLVIHWSDGLSENVTDLPAVDQRVSYTY